MEPAATETGPDRPRLTKREGRSPRDMALSLLVLIVPIALLLTFYRVVLDGDKPMTVDPAASFESAAREFTVLRPSGLGDDWRVTAATVQRGNGGITLRIGYVDPDDAPLQLVESTTPAATLVPAEVGKEGRRTGAYRTEQRTWMVYDARPGETALVLTEGDRTVLIVGKAEQRSLETFAASLR
ncbi:DUF4245 domain-containing protein [Actinoplanes teichomyceticus]|uniref:DUF4245 domain-containing protein n=1 Tax=Actinoplanes teichomyceticus TaxID=1867 RepID=UPI001A4A4D77|nr:DUF4245 domain-containing protein [Actinoplanes teichomyceticus]GIF10851.1 hypothetical protein Ate01nite_08830 [Actinoplanes teichomyceticus]